MQVAATPRGLPDPGAPPKPIQTLSRWVQFLGSIAAGIALPDAMLKHFISRADIEACIRSSDEERTRWDEARLASMKRGWSAFDFEDIFERIAGGMPVQQAIAEVRGVATGGPLYSAFNRIIIADATLNGLYMAALKARSLAMQDEILDIADDDAGDVIAGPKGDIPNNAAVNRSKLKVETRTRLMGAWHTKMFGEQKQQTQVNVQVNHAVRLEEARARRDTRAVPAIPQRVLDAAFSEIVPAGTSASNDWDDVPVPAPVDTTWLED